MRTTGDSEWFKSLPGNRTKCPFGGVWGLSDPGEIQTPDSFGEQFC